MRKERSPILCLEADVLILIIVLRHFRVVVASELQTKDRLRSNGPLIMSWTTRCGLAATPWTPRD